MTMEIFGYAPKAVTAVKYDNGVHTTLHYDGFSVTNHFKEGAEDYTAVLYAAEDTLYKEITGNGCFEKECMSFTDVVRKGQMHYSYEELMVPVYYMNAVKEAYETGKTVEIHFP